MAKRVRIKKDSSELPSNVVNLADRREARFGENSKVWFRQLARAQKEYPEGSLSGACFALAESARTRFNLTYENTIILANELLNCVDDEGVSHG